jgi:hypothetical protein
MPIFIYLSLAVYLAFYIFESPIRYFFSLLGADSLIFIRDVVIIAPLAVVFIKQLMDKKLHPAFLAFGIIITMHGIISIWNIRNFFVLFYCIKMLSTILAGAVFSPYLMNPPKSVVRVIFIFWLLTFVGVLIDKYSIFEFPWSAIGTTTIGDVQVDISRNWQIEGEDKRAGGFARSSINVAVIEPLLALILIFNIRALLPRLVIMLMTLATLYWTTQKASILAFAFVCGLLLIAYRKPIFALKSGITLAFLLMIFLPVLLPQFTMPNAGGVFSMGSFYMRVEDVWPAAWDWISRHEVIFFGVGLGGMGGAMRFYDLTSANPGDNMFIFLYAFFGLFAFIYMGWLWWVCMRVSNKSSLATQGALSIILFIIFYGVAITMLEDQMATLFLGAAAAGIAGEYLRQRRENKALENDTVMLNKLT